MAGAVAISLNTIGLWMSDLAHIPTAHGGLLKLLSIWVGPGADRLAAWVGHPGARVALLGEPTFQLGFHVLVGLLMAVFYGLLVSPPWKASGIAKGLVCALVVWLVNAAIVLPLIGEGFAGRAHLGLAGILVFASAHTLFFVVLAIGSEWLEAREPPRKA